MATAARRYYLTAETIEAADAWRLHLLHELAQEGAGLDEKVGQIGNAFL